MLNRYWRMSIKLRRKNSPIRREKSSEKNIEWESFFLMKKCLILTGSITVKMIVYGPLIGREQIGEVKKTARKICRKSDGMVSRMFRGRCVPCSVWKRHSPSSSLHQGSTACCSMIRKQSIWKQLDLSTRQWNTTYSPRDTRMVLPRFLDKDTWPANSPNLNSLDYCIWTNSLRSSTGIKWHGKVH